MSEKTTAEPYLSDEQIEAFVDISSWPQVDTEADMIEHRRDVVKSVRNHYEADRQRLLCENAALRERLALLDGEGVEPWVRRVG
jgi:hypothetical protein